MVRENRYIVFKRKDLTTPTAQQHADLYEIEMIINGHRERTGVKPLNCVVVESSWPEYEPTWKAIEQRVSGLSPKASAFKPSDFGVEPFELYFNAKYGVPFYLEETGYTGSVVLDAFKCGLDTKEPALEMNHEFINRLGEANQRLQEDCSLTERSFAKSEVRRHDLEKLLQQALKGEPLDPTISYGSPEAWPVPGDGVDDEFQSLRSKQTEAVMPLIGPLLDAWAGVPNDEQGKLAEDDPALYGALEAIVRAIEAE
jgi:hypothetical protein